MAALAAVRRRAGLGRRSGPGRTALPAGPPVSAGLPGGRSARAAAGHLRHVRRRYGAGVRPRDAGDAREVGSLHRRRRGARAAQPATPGGGRGSGRRPSRFDRGRAASRRCSPGPGSASTFVLVPRRAAAHLRPASALFIAPMRDLLVALPADIGHRVRRLAPRGVRGAGPQLPRPAGLPPARRPADRGGAGRTGGNRMTGARDSHRRRISTRR